VSRDDLEHFGGYGDGAAAEAGGGGAGRLCGGEVTVGEDGCSEEREPLGMGDRGRVSAFCSSGPRICWRLNSSVSFFILGVQQWVHMLVGDSLSRLHE
jgi:hypothetical protein